MATAAQEIFEDVLEKTRARAAQAQSIVVVEPRDLTSPLFGGRYKPVAQERFGIIEMHMAKLVLGIEDGQVFVVKSKLWDDIEPGETWSVT